MIVKETDWLRGSEGGQTCCYLELLASAPWDRGTLKEKIDCGRPRITPVGSCLLWQAVQLSRELGHEGRLGWHSLETAVRDYAKAFGSGLQTLGIDYEKGMEWLEVSARAASAFQSRMEPYLELSYDTKCGGDADLV